MRCVRHLYWMSVTGKNQKCISRFELPEAEKGRKSSLATHIWGISFWDYNNILELDSSFGTCLGENIKNNKFIYSKCKFVKYGSYLRKTHKKSVPTSIILKRWKIRGILAFANAFLSYLSICLCSSPTLHLVRNQNNTCHPHCDKACVYFWNACSLARYKVLLLWKR